MAEIPPRWVEPHTTRTMDDNRLDYQKTLTATFERLEERWDKLLHVKWSRESFALLSPLARELAQNARSHGQIGLAELAGQLQHHVDECISSGQVPQGSTRERLVVLLRGLRQSLKDQWDRKARRDSEAAVDIQEQTRRTPTVEVLLIDDDDPQGLVPKLREAGYLARHLATMAEVRTVFSQSLPAAVIVNVDFGGEPLAGIGVIAQIRVRYNFDVPIFFIAGHGDITTRLEAVQAGGVDFLTRPFDVSTLLGKLNDRLFHVSARGYRVLIVADKAEEAEVMTQALTAQGIVVHVVRRPLDIIKSMYRFQPDLLLLDLDLKEVSGLELAQVLRQHQDYSELPIVLLSSQADVSQRLAVLGAGGDDLISKPVDSDYLVAAVAYRLRRARALNAKLNALSQQDAVSGLYNRRHFLDQLERLEAGLGVTVRSLSVILIMLDNLRALRESTDVACADQVVEQAARRLRGVVGSEHKPARFGDAFFALVLSDTDQDALLELARAARQALETDAYSVEGHTLMLRTCIGLSIAEPGGHESQSLIRHADMACSVARERGGEHIHILHPQADRDLKESHQKKLLKEIRGAIEQERMWLVFQPIVSLRGDHQERYEVFLRMRGDQDQELLPESVFTVAQEHRLGVALDRWVIARSLSLLREHQSTGRSTLLFINISPATFRDGAFPNWLRGRLKQTGVQGSNLVFEVSEAMAEQHLERLGQFAEAVKALGCGFSLERFGSRSDSVDLLKSLSAGYVKLDGHVIQSLVGNANQQEQLKHLVEQLTALKATTIVSGIENLYTLPILWSCGINYVQGYFLQRPHKDMHYDFSGSAL